MRLPQTSLLSGLSVGSGLVGLEVRLWVGVTMLGVMLGMNKSRPNEWAWLMGKVG